MLIFASRYHEYYSGKMPTYERWRKWEVYWYSDSVKWHLPPLAIIIYSSGEDFLISLLLIRFWKFFTTKQGETSWLTAKLCLELGEQLMSADSHKWCHQCETASAYLGTIRYFFHNVRKWRQVGHFFFNGKVQPSTDLIYIFTFNIKQIQLEIFT